MQHTLSVDFLFQSTTLETYPVLLQPDVSRVKPCPSGSPTILALLTVTQVSLLVRLVINIIDYVSNSSNDLLSSELSGHDVKHHVSGL